VGRYQRWRSRQTTTISSSRASWRLQAGLLLNPPSSTSDSGPPQVVLYSSRRVLPSRLRVPSSLSERRGGRRRRGAGGALCSYRIRPTCGPGSIHGPPRVRGLGFPFLRGLPVRLFDEITQVWSKDGTAPFPGSYGMKMV